jgi:hypothetical protein
MAIKGLTDLIDWFWNTNQSTALFGIALGIIFRFLFDYTLRYLKSKNKSQVKFDLKGFILTVILSGFLSLILYSGLLSKIAELNSDLLVLSVSVQNGFFWQTLIGEIGKKISE